MLVSYFEFLILLFALSFLFLLFNMLNFWWLDFTNLALISTNIVTIIQNLLLSMISSFSLLRLSKACSLSCLGSIDVSLWLLGYSNRFKLFRFLILCVISFFCMMNLLSASIELDVSSLLSICVLMWSLSLCK